MRHATSPRPANGPIDVPLPGGALRLDIARSRWPLDRLCAFAVRRNPKRAFLIVSKVLGRHLPARPSAMRAAMRDLADLVPPALPGPILVVGLAETAVCLGQGLHEELAGRLGREAAFVQSTRQERAQPLLCRFEEPHSHAARHLVYRPGATDLGAVRSLLLVDDEVSTGTTLANLAAALVEALPGIERIAVATLTDWSGGTAWLERMPRKAACFSLLSGTLRWTPEPAPAEAENDSGPVQGGYGRTTGGSDKFAAPGLETLGLAPRQAVRIVGTGEFTFPPFLLAERLERAGHDVIVQATSRSPVLTWGPIADALAFRDNYGADAPNYLYNALSGEERRSIICHETPPGSIDPALVEALAGTTLRFERSDRCAP